jgi:hypothetical protein
VGARVNYCELNSTSLLFAASLYYVLYGIKFFCPNTMFFVILEETRVLLLLLYSGLCLNVYYTHLHSIYVVLALVVLIIIKHFGPAHRWSR